MNVILDTLKNGKKTKNANAEMLLLFKVIEFIFKTTENYALCIKLLQCFK